MKYFIFFIFCSSATMEKTHIIIGIIGDFNPASTSHQKTNDALIHAANKLGKEITIEWVPTLSLESQSNTLLDGYHALICAPGSPYKSMVGALNGIRYARESKIPFLAMCGGFQHVVLEFARNVLHIQDADHEEYNPDASNLFIIKLACSIKGKKMALTIAPQSLAGRSYHTNNVEEEYFCNFALNNEYESLIHDNGLRIVGFDEQKQARILELSNHPFFIATLFVPQVNSSVDNPHPLFTDLLNAALTK